ncbi:type II toxin-antitoxin system antitoxin SocA domain-containing protein [Phocaeicola plebeius]|uniref:type II toxin-antitoxin system antitoxin SocA domain-containing protein n=1 Tax=Phocaeicola plebeius TaxID=310297 RepID=UPI0026EEEA41|nr:type II toxin-antitoxin system antitoxin SocA domain-containing protein [Phocaeicola plebeius]MCI6051267.1 Panacea domain-containing protein [Phocaeicola plebeius]MDD6912187.1 DUF4065 domain-containing protein [Phocaeicola plebeius]MDY5978206.1 DUF4065 domain-containing protein [Phocaeicola plebeius]
MAIGLLNKNKIKLLSFEYLLYHFMIWYEEDQKISDTSHHKFLSEFSRLKALKLLFLVAAIQDDCQKDLLPIFDKFYAMQHGPVESDIYNAMVRDDFKYFRFQNRQTSFKEQVFSGFEEIENKRSLDNAIYLLKKANPKIVSYPAMELVDITHKWISWKSAYMVAQMLGKGSQLMPTDLIKNDHQFFTL